MTAPGPQPRDRPGRRQDRRRDQGHHQHDDLGQSLRHPVPGHLPREGRTAKNAAETINDQQWLENDFIPTVQKRGAAIIEARGASSAASAANAAIDHVHDWVLGTPDGDWVSMAIPSDGSYDVPEGLISSFPVTCSNGSYEIVQGLEVSDFSRSRIEVTVNELGEEREAVKQLDLI